MSQKYFVEVDDHGTRFWYSDPEMKIRHRVGGPAIECADGSQHWYQDGLQHRVGGPAITMIDGRRFWLQNDLLHRLDGPAFEGGRGSRRYFIEGKPYGRAAFDRRVKELSQPTIKEMTVADVEKALGHPVKIIK